jgi:undecaprenyl-diphosphatase
MAAGALESLKLAGSAEPVQWVPLLLAATISAVIAVLTIHFFLRWLERIGLMPFVIYRILLGALILVCFV